jgi:hypothetical protein
MVQLKLTGTAEIGHAIRLFSVSNVATRALIASYFWSSVVSVTLL